MRKAKIDRKTSETNVSIELDLEGKGEYNISTGVNFLDHVLTAFAKHGKFDLKVKATGDLEIEPHHTIEDVGIVLGTAFKNALGDKKGIERFGFCELPMDDALCKAVVDLSGRSYLVFKGEFKREKVGEMPTEMVKHFFEAFCQAAEANVHLDMIYGGNEHHKIECLFKAFGKAMKQASTVNPSLAGTIQSTKGSL